MMNRSLAACVALVVVGVLISSITVSAQKFEAPLANPSADIDQCRNGTLASPNPCVDSGGGSSGWVNGNAGAQNSHWAEDQFIAYRARFSDLSTSGSHTVIMGYDIFQQTKHAIDYLGTFNATETTADPCSGVTGFACNVGSPDSTAAIPGDSSTVTNQINPNNGLPIVQKPGVFTMWGGTITSVAYVNPYGGGDERRIAVTFTASVPNPVLAWSGHIAWIGDWGQGNSASAISGSPYHMRLLTLDGASLGNQDRSLKNDAVVASAAVVIKKTVTTVDGSNAAFTSFGFTSTANFGFTSFSLIDNNVPGPDTQISTAIMNFGATNTITVTENPVDNWTLAGITCTPTVGTTANFPNRSVDIQPAPATVTTCTFNNTQFVVTAAPADISGRVLSDGGYGIRGAVLTLTDLNTGEVRTAVTNNFGYYRFDNAMTEDVYHLTVIAKRYTFANNSRTFTLMDSLSGVDFVTSPENTLPPTTMEAPALRTVKKVDAKLD